MLDQITPLVLTFNEESNIHRALDSLFWASQIVVLDSLSSDATPEICRRHKAVRFIQRPFDTHTKQWNFGLNLIETPWVLALDADYEVPRDLVEEIEGLSPEGEVTGYSAGFLFRIFGHPLRASVYPPRVILFRKNQAQYTQQGHTQWLDITGRVRRLENAIIHDDRKPLSRWLSSQDNYMKIEAPHLLATPDSQLTVQDRLRKRIFFAPLAMFLYLLFGRRLIFDGWPGWYYVMQRTLAEMLLSLRLLTEREKLERN